MATEPTAAGPRGAGSAHEGGAPRTGPVGRLARLLLGAALGWLAYDLWADRAFIVRELDPGLLVLTGFAVFGAYHIAGLAGLGRVMLAVLAVAGAGSAVLAAVLEGTVWAAPVSWLVWGLDLGVLVAIAASTLVAAIIGTCCVSVFDQALGTKCPTRFSVTEACCNPACTDDLHVRPPGVAGTCSFPRTS